MYKLLLALALTATANQEDAKPSGGLEAFTRKEAVEKSPPDARAHETPGPPCRELALPSLLPRRPHKGRRRIPREPLRVKKT